MTRYENWSCFIFVPKRERQGHLRDCCSEELETGRDLLARIFDHQGEELLLVRRPATQSNCAAAIRTAT